MHSGLFILFCFVACTMHSSGFDVSYVDPGSDLGVYQCTVIVIVDDISQSDPRTKFYLHYVI